MHTQLSPGARGGRWSFRALSEFKGEQSSVLKHTLQGHTRRALVWDVCPAKSRFLPQNRASHQATHAKKVGPPHSHGVALPGSALQFPGAFTALRGRRTKGPRDQEWGGLLPSRPGKVMAPHPIPSPSGRHVRGPHLSPQHHVANHCISIHSQHKQITWAASPCTGRCPKHLLGLSSPPPSFRGN